MGVIDKMVVQPVLWIMYITLPLFSVPTYPARDVKNAMVTFLFLLFCAVGGWYALTILEVIEEVYRDKHLFLVFCLTIVFLIYICMALFFFMAALSAGHDFLLSLTKLVAQSVIAAFKNRPSCQLLSLIASLLIGILGSSSATKYLAIIPVVVGFILAFPDFDLEPGLKFKLRFTRFVTCNMDEKSVQKLLDSKHCKMLCCNEMMPSLANLESPVFSGFMNREDRQICDTTVNPKYEIGLGYVTTLSNEHQIDVVITTHCGIKRMTMRNTALSRYNLHNSAGFWRDNPSVGILNHGDMKTHCISTDEWIKYCGSEEFIFLVHLIILELFRLLQVYKTRA